MVTLLNFSIEPKYAEFGIVINPCTAEAGYTAHKKFMNGFACLEFDPYDAIISTVCCQKTIVGNWAK